MLIRSRREFLRAALKSVGALGATGALAKFGEMNALAAGGANYQALVCIFLAGGNDGHNTVIPISTGQQSYSLYSQARQALALPQASLPVINNGNDVYGLHPKLQELQALYNAGHAAVVANIGMLVQPVDRTAYNSNNAAILPTSLFSHSDQTNQWQSAIPNGFGVTGWGGRVEDNLASLNSGAATSPITATTGCGLFCTGQQTFPATVPVGGVSLLQGTANSPSRLQAVQQLMTFDNGLQLVQAANAIFNRGLGFSNSLNAALATAKVTTTFPSTLIGSQLQTVARLMSIRSQLGVARQIFFCQLGGFDTHTGQLAAQDQLLQQLSQAVYQFYLATQELGVDQQVATFTASEFGRTLTPNGNAGTDHAWGSHHFVIGSSVLGGKFYGQFPLLALGSQYDANNRGTLIPTSSVEQYAATMAQWFGVNQTSLNGIFPYLQNFQTPNLGFLG
jgi:uncharacterized protein (DUF1501 family)